MKKEMMYSPLVDITKILKGIPDRKKPCDRETTEDGTEVSLEGDMGEKPHHG